MYRLVHAHDQNAYWMPVTDFFLVIFIHFFIFYYSRVKFNALHMWGMRSATEPLPWQQYFFISLQSSFIGDTLKILFFNTKTYATDLSLVYSVYSVNINDHNIFILSLTIFSFSTILEEAHGMYEKLVFHWFFELLARLRLRNVCPRSPLRLLEPYFLNFYSWSLFIQEIWHAWVLSETTWIHYTFAF